VQRRIGEDQVELLARREPRQVPLLESDAAPRVRAGALEHRLGEVEAQRLTRGERLVQLAREEAGPAAEIDDAQPRLRLHQRQEVAERLLPLPLEAQVLGGVPVGGGTHGCGRTLHLCGAPSGRLHENARARRAAPWPPPGEAAVPKWERT